MKGRKQKEDESSSLLNRQKSSLPSYQAISTRSDSKDLNTVSEIALGNVQFHSQITKFKIQNLCCEAEVQLIKDLLHRLEG